MAEKPEGYVVSKPQETDANLPEGAAPGKELSQAARNALMEAAARRSAEDQQDRSAVKEINGPKGEEPTRFGDWERSGIAYDF